MRGCDYVRGVFRELVDESRRGKVPTHGAFIEAALAVMHELDSPLKEETLVRLVALEREEERASYHILRACG